MRFRRWPRPAAYEDTARKRAAFLRKQRLEREALPLERLAQTADTRPVVVHRIAPPTAMRR